MNSIPETDCYVLDGGSLLHRLPWKKGDSYGAIAESYADFTLRHYGQATVVFDGYGEGPSIKDNTHQRRGKNLHPIVSFTAETEFSGKKDDFIGGSRGTVHRVWTVPFTGRVPFSHGADMPFLVKRFALFRPHALQRGCEYSFCRIVPFLD